MSKESIKRIGRQMAREKAQKMVKNYLKRNPASQSGFLYGRDILESMLKNSEVEGIWFFKGVDENGAENLLLFPSDEEGNIMMVETKSIESAGFGNVCPPSCPSGL